MMEWHAEALFRHSADGRLVTVNEAGGGPAPRFFLGRTEAGPVYRTRVDVSTRLQRDLGTIALDRSTEGQPVESALLPIDSREFTARLEHDAPIEKTWTGPAFAFPSQMPALGGAVLVPVERLELLRRYFAAWIPDVLAGSPLAAVVVDGSAVSVCCSVRQTARAHEAGVETVEAFRGRGLAVAAVAGWADELKARDIVPLYSTSWDNTASRALARKLGLTQFGSDLHIT